MGGIILRKRGKEKDETLQNILINIEGNHIPAIGTGNRSYHQPLPWYGRGESPEGATGPTAV